ARHKRCMMCTGPNGLGDVFSGPCVECGYLVGLGLPGRQNDDRDAGPAPQALDDLDAGDAGEAEVEDDDVGVVVGGLAEGVLPRGGEVDVVAPGPEVDGQGPEDLRLVVDDEDPFAHDGPTPAPGGGRPDP